MVRRRQYNHDCLGCGVPDNVKQRGGTTKLTNGGFPNFSRLAVNMACFSIGSCSQSWNKNFVNLVLQRPHTDLKCQLNNALPFAEAREVQPTPHLLYNEQVTLQKAVSASSIFLEARA